MSVCRYCERPVDELDAVKTLPYWNYSQSELALSEFVCHAGCKISGEKQEAYDCQVIDADCNDCRYFLRAAPGIPKWTGRNFTLCTNIVNGWCARFSRITCAWPHSWTGRECFVHRREPIDIIGR